MSDDLAIAPPRLFPADHGDADAVMQVMASAFDPRYGEAWTLAQLRTLFAVPGTRLCAASIAGTIIGFYAARVAGPESELLLLAVNPAWRRRSIGALLLQDWVGWAANSGVSDYFLEMRADNPAKSLYESAGFVECGRRSDYYTGQDGVQRDAITMRYIRS
jgi:[ribosomal protein S18]-alanine N-acetyltransferase